MALRIISITVANPVPNWEKPCIGAQALTATICAVNAMEHEGPGKRGMGAWGVELGWGWGVCGAVEHAASVGRTCAQVAYADFAHFPGLDDDMDLRIMCGFYGNIGGAKRLKCCTE